MTAQDKGGFAWEDVELGKRERSGALVISEADIVSFARAFDPLPIHVDAAAGQASPFGSLTASGCHMLAIRQRLLYDFAYPSAVVASIGLDDVRYVAPLRPGQSCTVEIEFLEARPSRSRPELGSAVIDTTLLADGLPVLRLKDIVLMRRRG